jgi:hypothetical protein
MNACTYTFRATHRALLSTAVIASLATIAVTAQEPQPGMASSPYTSTDQLVGAKLQLSPDAEALREAAREGEKAEGPTATATDWLVDGNDGSVQYAVVSLGGFLGIGDKTVLIPAGDLKWNQSAAKFQLDWTADQLKARTPFDLGKACEAGLDASCKAAASTAKGADMPRTDKGSTEASGKRNAALQNAQFTAPTDRLCKASALSALPVHAGSEQFGKVSDLIVDRRQHRVVLAVVDHGTTLGMGGTSYLVPYTKLTPCVKSGDQANEPTMLCAATSTKDELTKCVVYEQPKVGVVDPAAAKKALEMAGRHE